MRPRTHRILAPAATLTLFASLSAQCQNEWLDGYGIPGVIGLVDAVVAWDPDGPGPLPQRLIVGGRFQAAGTVVCDGFAAWDPATAQWSALPTPPQPAVTALAVASTGELLVAGGAIGQVHRFDGTTWTQFGSAFNGAVAALLVDSAGTLFASGAFQSVGGTMTGGVARWDGSTWRALPGMPPGSVSGLAERANGDLVFGTGTNVVSFDGVAVSSLGSSPVGPVLTIAVAASGDVFVGGTFGVGRYSGANWTAVPGLSSAPYSGPAVRQLLRRSNGSLVVAGDITSAGGAATDQIAVLDPQSLAWSTLGSGIGYGYPVSGGATALAELANGELVVAGRMTQAGAVDVAGIARHDGGQWRALSDGIPDGASCGVAIDDQQFVVGGSFRNIGNVPASFVARWDGTNWQAIGGGLFGSTFAAQVHDVVVLPSGDLLVGGEFETANGAPVGPLVQWDGTAWSQPGGGLASPPGWELFVTKILPLPNGDLVVGGVFETAGGVQVTNIARYDGSTWSALGAGMPPFVEDMAMRANGNLVVAAQHELREWDGIAWTVLASYPNEYLRAVTVLRDDSIVVGGYRPPPQQGFVDFLPSGTRILASGLSFVHELDVLPNGDLLVAGQFDSFGGVAADGLVRLAGGNGAISVPIDGRRIFDIETFPNGDLLATGGTFALGGQANLGVTRLGTTCPATVVASGSGCSGSGGANVLVATSLPWLGGTFSAMATGMPNNGLALEVRGLMTATTPLASILPQGQPGCDLLVSPDLIGFVLPAGGVATVQFAIPNAMVLVGQVLQQQIVPIELGALGNIVGLTSTNRLTITIGAF